jgi:carbon monoxide dehydrogenase subunit G
MRAFAFDIHIDRSPQIVWDYLTDLTRAPEWRPLVQRMETVDGKPLATGSVIELTMEVLGELRKRRSVTTVFEPPRRWVLRSGSDGIEGVWEFAVAADGAGSRVAFTLDLTTQSLLRKLMLPLIARSERTVRAGQLERLKAAVEAR